jgi:sterol desaturase/sphingolipid hydroxylase (fatty acid hydroxylase superfamily)
MVIASRYTFGELSLIIVTPCSLLHVCSCSNLEYLVLDFSFTVSYFVGSFYCHSDKYVGHLGDNTLIFLCADPHAEHHKAQEDHPGFKRIGHGG